MCECVVCRQTITNPVSPEVLSRQIESWLYEIRPDFVSRLKELSLDLINLNAETTNCVISGKEMNVCPYCYTNHILEWLEETSPKLGREFVKFFNFDLERTGYSLKYLEEKPIQKKIIEDKLKTKQYFKIKNLSLNKRQILA